MKTTDDWLDEINAASFHELVELMRALIVWSSRYWPFVEDQKPFRNAMRKALDILTSTE